MDESVIPKGVYCHDEDDIRKICPYWHLIPQHREQENGYCHFMKFGDWEGSFFSLLWDQVKECGINDEWDDEE